jgi:2-C-methyl-D-erythritol 4-phosphate cytidylyltransferase
VDEVWAAVIVAAGRGERFGSPKQFVEIAGVPMVGWSVRTFAQMPEVAALIVVTEPDWIAPMRELVARYAPQSVSSVVAGGASRQESVRNGLLAVPERCGAVFVHDGARPLVAGDDVRAAMRMVGAGRASALGTPVVDTIKIVDGKSRRVLETLDRRRLWAAQTPQFATAADLARAHEHALRDGIEATDDATLLERIGIAVTIVPASGENFKVTHPADRERAEALLRERVSANVS